MTRSLTFAILLAALAACGNDQPASTASTTGATPAPTPSDTTAPEPAAAPTAPAAEPAAAMSTGDDDEFTYDAIDVSKLENAWWSQYSAGG